MQGEMPLADVVSMVMALEAESRPRSDLVSGGLRDSEGVQAGGPDQGVGSRLAPVDEVDVGLVALDMDQLTPLGRRLSELCHRPRAAGSRMRLEIGASGSSYHKRPQHLTALESTEHQERRTSQNPASARS